MIVKYFHYMSKDAPYDLRWKNWSRAYEYHWVLNAIKSVCKHNMLIHNTCCGWWDIHLEFAEALKEYWTVINTDIETIRWDKKPDNYKICDILQPYELKADITLCISALEHLSNPIQALDNLISKTNEWWYVICTFDCPPVNLWDIEHYLSEKCWDMPVEDRLDPVNSIYPHPEWKGINIISLIIQK